MKNPEPKHLVPYLLYRVKVKWFRKDDNSFQTSELTISDYPFLTKQLFKLILRPLSDLTDINSKFYSDSNMDLTDQVELNSLIDEILYDKQSYKSIEDIPYKYMLILFEYHIDVFGLIPEGLAIDINTI